MKRLPVLAADHSHEAKTPSVFLLKLRRGFFAGIRCRQRTADKRSVSYRWQTEEGSLFGRLAGRLFNPYSLLAPSPQEVRHDDAVKTGKPAGRQG